MRAVATHEPVEEVPGANDADAADLGFLDMVEVNVGHFMRDDKGLLVVCFELVPQGRGKGNGLAVGGGVEGVGLDNGNALDKILGQAVALQEPVENGLGMLAVAGENLGFLHACFLYRLGALGDEDGVMVMG